MARTNPRLMMGVGVISAFLLVGGPGLAPAIADPGHSGRGDKGSSDRISGDSRGGSKRGGDDRSGRRADGGGNRKSDDGPRADDGLRGGDGLLGGDSRTSFGTYDGPQTRVGSGRADIQQLSPGIQQFSPGIQQLSPGIQQLSPGALSPGANSGSSRRSGSDHPGAPKAGFKPPRVTIGNGRSPGILSGDPRPRWRAVAPEPAAPPAPPPPAPPPPPPAAAPEPWTVTIDLLPAMPKQFVVVPRADWSPPLWGIAGLLLIPAAGAAIGYRQARAAQDTEKLRRP